MTRFLLIDSGNTRVKLALARGAGAKRRWTDGEALAQSQLSAEPERLATAIATLCAQGPVDAAAGANVAGAQAAARIEAALARTGQPPIRWLRSSAQACGVTNRYAEPERLGADRWASLLGARQRHPRDDVLVATFGTATTLDALSREGEFLGGVILPGFDLMRASLHRRTAQLPLAAGSLQPLPTNTDDAIASGCAAAQAGAVLIQLRHLAERTGREPRLLVAGGGAGFLAPLLPQPFEQVDRLVLEGVLQALCATDPQAGPPA